MHIEVQSIQLCKTRKLLLFFVKSVALGGSVGKFGISAGRAAYTLCSSRLALSLAARVCDRAAKPWPLSAAGWHLQAGCGEGSGQRWQTRDGCRAVVNTALTSEWPWSPSYLYGYFFEVIFAVPGQKIRNWIPSLRFWLCGNRKTGCANILISSSNAKHHNI